jgi:hypothetical protein
MTGALSALVLPDLVIQRSLVNAEMLSRRLHERDGTIRGNAPLLDAKCRSKEPDHHAIRLHIRQPSEHPEIAP